MFVVLPWVYIQFWKLKSMIDRGDNQTTFGIVWNWSDRMADLVSYHSEGHRFDSRHS